MCRPTAEVGCRQRMVDFVSQENFKFSFGYSTPLTRALGNCTPERILDFSSAIDLVRYLSVEQIDDYIPIQTRIEHRIMADPVARRWQKNRARLSSLRHFPKYRRGKSREYHAAAHAVSAGKSTEAQSQMYAGLCNEIAQSPVRLPSGQILFHGCESGELFGSTHVVSFLSTSLCPVVARNSAFRRAGPNYMNGHPAVLIIHLETEVPALWGQTGNSCEFELLLPPGLTCSERSRDTSGKFDIYEFGVSAIT